METENNRRKNLEHHRGRKNRGNGNAASGGEKELKIGKSSALGTMSGNKGSGGSGGRGQDGDLPGEKGDRATVRERGGGGGGGREGGRWNGNSREV